MRALKENLSEYLDRAARGETIRVTDRGEPKAILGPLPGALEIQRGVDEKWIRAGNGAPVASVQRFKARQTVQESLREDRGE